MPGIGNTEQPLNRLAMSFSIRPALRRHFWAAVRVIGCLSLCLAGSYAAAQDGASSVLARVDLVDSATDFPLPIYALLMDARGQEYILAIATESELDAAGWPYQVLDAGGDSGDYLIARSRRGDGAAAAAGFNVVHDDGRQLVIRAGVAESQPLADRGFELRRLPVQPMRVAAPAPGKRLADPFVYSALVQDMVNQVSPSNLYTIMREVTGEDRVVIRGDVNSVPTRHTQRSAALRDATEYCAQHLRALGLTVHYHDWSSSGLSSRNIVGVLGGGAKSNEFVFVVAHLDDQPNYARAPGADDNASGSAGVLGIADVLAKFRFERTIRFVLFTGEEEGMLGSLQYVPLVAAGGETVAGVLNLDMIGWDAAGGPDLRLHTRAGNAGDRSIAAIFTNVVARYGLSGSLTPIITADNETASDHSSFWNYGYPAILAIEEDYSDFNAYYHTTNDTLVRMNLPYFYAFVRAGAGTVAHLAAPVERVPVDVLQVENGDWRSGVARGVGTLHIRHEPGAAEDGPDYHDVAWTNVTTSTNATWLKIHTEPYSALLQTDARPTNSETVFHALLTGVSTNGSAFSCTNRLRFRFLVNPESNRIYTAKIHVDARYAVGSNDFTCVTNVRQVIAGGGYVNLPALTNLTNGAVYGTLDIGERLVANDPTNFPLQWTAVGSASLGFEVAAQIGGTVVDVLEVSTNLEGGWLVFAGFTNYVPPDATNFDGGWQPLSRNTASPAPGSPDAYFRLRRNWLSP
jgi:hypothetical protein